MSFRITGLPAANFQPLFGLSDAALKSRGVLRRIAGRKPGFPCRISLQDAEAGESVLLLNYEHQPALSPFRSSHAIYVREAARETYQAEDQVPEVMGSRILSVRAFDGDGMLLESDLTDGSRLEAMIGEFFANPDVAYLHAHYAKPGCFAARIDRA
jgi:hypothetical protein